MNKHCPDRWVLIELKHKGEVLHKLFGTWSGGYLSGDSWRLNSGISGVKDSGDFFLFQGYSGSEYKCYKDNYGVSLYYTSILDTWTETHKGKLKVLSMTQALEWATEKAAGL